MERCSFQGIGLRSVFFVCLYCNSAIFNHFNIFTYSCHATSISDKWFFSFCSERHTDTLSQTPLKQYTLRLSQLASKKFPFTIRRCIYDVILSSLLRLNWCCCLTSIKSFASCLAACPPITDSVCFMLHGRKTERRPLLSHAPISGNSASQMSAECYRIKPASCHKVTYGFQTFRALTFSYTEGFVHSASLTLTITLSVNPNTNLNRGMS